MAGKKKRPAAKSSRNKHVNTETSTKISNADRLKNYQRQKIMKPAVAPLPSSLPPQLTSCKPRTPSPPPTDDPTNKTAGPSSIKIVLPRPATRTRTEAAPYTQPPRNGACYLLKNLPAELRNKIFELVLDGVFVAEGGFQFWIRGQRKDFSFDKCRHPPGLQKIAVQNISLFTTDRNYDVRFDFEDAMVDLRKMVPDMPSTVRHRSTNRQQWHISRSKRTLPRPGSNFGLLFACRQTHDEVLPLVYSKSVFAFRHLWRTRELLFDEWTPTKARSVFRPYKFPKVSTPFPATGLPWLRSICLEVDAHGPPTLSDMVAFEHRYYAEWACVVHRIVRTLPGLENVSLFVHVPYRMPCIAARLSIADIWARPFALFRDAPRLRTAAVRLDAPWHAFPSILDAFAEYMRRHILLWDEPCALEALKFAKDRYTVAHPGVVRSEELYCWKELLAFHSIEDTPIPEGCEDDLCL